MLVERVNREGQDLHAAAVELRLYRGHVTKLRRADRREVLRVREEHGPGVADPVVEADRAVGGHGDEVRGGVTDRQAHSVSVRGVGPPPAGGGLAVTGNITARRYPNV